MLPNLSSTYVKWFFTWFVTIFVIIFMGKNIEDDIRTLVNRIKKENIGGNSLEVENLREISLNTSEDVHCVKKEQMVFLKTHKVKFQ